MSEAEVTKIATRLVGAVLALCLLCAPAFAQLQPFPSAGGCSSNCTFSGSPPLTLNPSANSNALVISGGSITGSNTTSPGINITGTLNTSGVVDGAALFANITNTASGAGSTLMDLQVGGSSKFSVSTGGVITLPSNGVLTANSLNIGPPSAGNTYFGNIESATAVYDSVSSGYWEITRGQAFGMAGSIPSTPDAALTSPSPAIWHLGLADAASPVAQTLGVQGVAAGTSNTGGALLTIAGSISTGNVAGGDISFKVAQAGGSGSSQNSLTEGFRIAADNALPKWPSSSTGAGTQTLTNSPCTGLTTEQWIPVEITGQTGKWYVPACQ